MAIARLWHTATLLPNGKVLVVGGGDGVRDHQAELYDPDTGTWSFTGALARSIASQTATLLQDGEVLIAGGFDFPGVVTGFAELYDVANGLWNRIDNLPIKGTTIQQLCSRMEWCWSRVALTIIMATVTSETPSCTIRLA